MFRSGRRVAVLLAAIGVAACFIDRLTAPGVGTLSVTLTADSVVAIGDTFPARLTIGGAATGGPSRVLWSSSNPAVATVDSAGQVRGVAKGAVTITGKVTAPELDSSVSRAASVRVAYASIAIDSVDSLTGLGLTRLAQVRGRTAQGAAVALLSGQSVQWHMAPDTTVMTVDASGLLTARANGTAFIVATFEGLRDSVPVKVRQVARSVSFTGGASFTFTSLNRDTTVGVTVVDVAGAPIASPTIAWSSTNTLRTTVSVSGILRALTRSANTIQAQVDTAKGVLVTQVSQVPKALVLTAGAGQVDTVGRATPVAPSVQVRDAGATGIPGVAVTFTVVGNGGKVGSASVPTDTGGVATTAWTLGDTVKTDSLRVSSGGIDTVSFTATVVASHAKSLAASSAQAETTVVNTTVPVPPSVVVRDTFANTVSGVPVTFVVDSGAGKLIGATPLTGGNGVAAVTSWQVGTVAGPNNNRISASTPLLPGMVAVFRATGTPGQASGTTSTVSITKDTLIAGQSAVVTLHARDAFGNAESTGGAIVAFGLSGGVSRGAFSTVIDSGTGTYTASLKGTIAGAAATIDATLNGASVTTALPTVLVKHGIVGQLALRVGDNQTATAGTAVALAPSVVVEDSFANAIAGDTVSWGITQGNGLVLGPQAVSDAAGVAAVSTWVLSATAGPNALTASVGGVNRVFNGTGTQPTVGASFELGSLFLGMNPVGVAVDSLRNLAYVADSGSDLITVIDGATSLAIDSIPVGRIPVAVAVDPGTNKIYVANQGDSSVAVIDGVTRAVVATIPLGVGSPVAIVVNTATDTIYVASANAGQIEVIDGTTNTLVGQNVMFVGSAEFLAVNPFTNRLFVAGQSSGGVFVFDGSNRGLITQVSISNPTGLDVDPGRHSFFVLDGRNGAIRSFDADADTAIGSASLSILPSRLVVDGGSGKMYATDCGGTVSIVDEGTLQVVGSAAGRLSSGCFSVAPLRLAINAATHRLFIANPSTGVVTIDDGLTGALAGLTLRVGNIFGLALDAVRSRLYASVAPAQLVVVDPSTHQFLDAINTRFFGDVALNPNTNLLWLSGGDTIIPYNATSMAAGAPIPLPAAVSELAVNPVTNRVYGVGPGAAYVLDGATGSLLGSLGGAVLTGIAIDTVRNVVYLARDILGLFVYDGATNNLLASPVVSGAQGGGVAVNSTLNRAYLTDLDSPGQVLEFDGVADTLDRRMFVGVSPPTAYVDGRKNLFYVPNNASDLWVMSAYLDQVVTILSPGMARHLVFDSVGNGYAAVGDGIVTIQP